jgi:bifunctional DNA-binding transcriptional regulator/antitoxin component of YhaV-PrlF toxin-antitoxin module
LPQGRRCPYSRIAIPQRVGRKLGLKPGEVVDIRIDPLSERVHRVDRVFGEPRRDAAW